MKPEIEIEF